MKIGEIGEWRLCNVLHNDKKENPSAVLEFVKSDIHNLLENYMMISELKTNMELVDNEYVLSIVVRSPRLKNVGFIKY